MGALKGKGRHLSRDGADLGKSVFGSESGVRETGDLRVSAGESGLWPRDGAEIPSWLAVHDEKDSICLRGCTYQGWEWSPGCVRCGWSGARHGLEGN